MSIYKELEASPIGLKLIAAGYAIMNTGGHVMCWGRETADESLILIGQGDGELGEDGRQDDWGTCVTDNDSGYLEWLTKKGTLDFCIAEMAKIDADASKLPAPGTRVEFTADWDIFPITIIKARSRGVVVALEEGEANFSVLLDKREDGLEEWFNEVHLAPGDFATDNGVTEAGWVLLHIRSIIDEEDLYVCPQCDWKGSRATAAKCDLIIQGDEEIKSVPEGGCMCPVCSSPLDELSSLNVLIEEFQKWGDEKGLPPLSADELLSEMRAETNGSISTDEEKEYVLNFLAYWEMTCDAERKAHDHAKKEAV